MNHPPLPLTRSITESSSFSTECSSSYLSPPPPLCMHLTEIKLSLSLSLLYIAAATAVTPSHPDPFHSSCVLATDRHALAPISRYPCEAPYAASICVTSILESFVPGSTLTSTLFVRRLDLPSPIQPRIPWPSLPTANAEAPPSALSCSNMGNIVFPPPPSSIPAAPCFFLLFLPSMFQAPRSIRRRHTGCDKVICCKQGLPS